jgi:hypothetical protein
MVDDAASVARQQKSTPTSSNSSSDHAHRPVASEGDALSWPSLSGGYRGKSPPQRRDRDLDRQSFMSALDDSNHSEIPHRELDAAVSAFATQANKRPSNIYVNDDAEDKASSILGSSQQDDGDEEISLEQ